MSDNAIKCLNSVFDNNINSYDKDSFSSYPMNDSLRNIRDPKRLVRASYKSISHSKMYQKAINELKNGYPVVDFHNQNSEQALALGDAYTLVRCLPTGKFTLIATDPVYFMNHYCHQHKDKLMRDEKRYGKANVENMHDGFDFSILDEFVRLCYGNTINILLCCSKDMAKDIDNYFAKHYNCSSANGHIEDLVFTKGNARMNKTGFRFNSEHCLYIHKNVKFRHNTNKYHMSTAGYMVTTNQAEDKLYHHGTIKPLFIIKNWLQMALDIDLPNGVRPAVLDPFCGSGTTAVACKMLGVDGIFIDHDKDHAIKPSIKRLLTPEYVDWKLIEVEADHLKTMQSEFTKLMKCTYESTMTSLRSYKIQIKNDKNAVHKLNQVNLYKHLNGAVKNLVDDDELLHYIHSNPNCVDDSKSALHAEIVHPKRSLISIR